MDRMRLVLFVGMLTQGCGGGPKVTPTPLGMVGAPYDFRHLLGPELERPAELTSATIDLGHVLQLGERGKGTTVRVVVWRASDDDLTLGPVYLAAVGVEVMENPNGTEVTWKARDPKPDDSVRLEINVAWYEGGHLMELLVPGHVDNRGGVFVPDPR